MAGKTYIIGCRLPNGLTITNPKDTSKSITLAGANKALLIGSDFATTEVDAEFWDAWKEFNAIKGKEYAPLKSGAIFEASSPREAADKGKELQSEKTGFEGMPQEDASKGIKAAEKD